MPIGNIRYGSSSNRGGFRLGPVQNVFTGADRAAAEAARDIYANDSANSAWLPQYNADTSLNIRLEYTENSNAIATYQVRNRVGDAWVNNQSFTAVQGQPGTDGIDGTALEFTNETERDSFFQARPDLLRNGLPINVGMGDDVVTIQIWTGESTPSAYDSSNQSTLFIPASLRTSTGSLELGGAHTVSSGNENVFVRNEMSRTAFFPTWQSIGDHSVPATRTVSNRPIARVYGDFQSEETGGAARTTGAVPYNVDVTLARNESVHGLRVVPAETYEGIAEYRITRLPEEVVVYTQRIEASVVPDVPFDLWFSTPVDSQSGTQFRAEIIKADGTNGIVRPTQDDDDPYVEIRFRTYQDVSVALLSEVGEENVQADWDETDTLSDTYIANKPTIPVDTGEDNVQSDWNEVDTNSDAFILNKPDIPADTNDFVNSLTTTVSGQELTITLGRTGALGDLTQTVTLPGGGTTPPQAEHTNYIDVTADALAATVDTTTAMSSDDLNPTVTLETFTGNRYIQILQSMAHTEFTSIVIAGVNQKGGFTVNENARTISGQAYRQYVTTNMITDALSGDVISMTGAV